MADSKSPRDLKKSSRERSIEWIVRPMRHDDIDRCLEIWLKVELCESRQTVASAWQTDPNGFYVAERVPDGQVVGMCAGPMTRDDTAFMGFYAVDPEFQGLGIGRELWAKTVGRLDGSMNIGLYGVPAMSAKYKKSGFKLEDSITMSIYESKPNDGALRLDLLKDLDDLRNDYQQQQQPQFSHELKSSFKIEFIDGQTSEKLFRKLVAYDASVNMFSREKLLRNYLIKPSDVPLTLALVRCKSIHNFVKQQNSSSTKEQQQQHRSTQNNNNRSTGTGGPQERKSSCCYAKPSQQSIIEDETLSTSLRTSCSLSNSVVNVGSTAASAATQLDSTSNGQEEESSLAEPLVVEESIIGYGCVRFDNTSGGMIGPIYADSDELCEILLKNLLVKFKLLPGAKYSIMSLSSNETAGKILEKIGLTEVDKCSRMFTKFIPEASMSKIYYVHSPNFTLF